MSHERCAGSMSHKLGGVEACRPLPAILQAGLAQHTGAAFVSTSARACACGSAMEARRRALQRSGCSDTSTQLLATTSLFCCGIVTYDAGPARTGVAASRIGDARCCDGCAHCRVGSIQQRVMRRSNLDPEPAGTMCRTICHWPRPSGLSSPGHMCRRASNSARARRFVLRTL